MRLLATMVVRNEAGRHLDAVLAWLVRHVTPHVAVYDDGSDDDTVAIARDYGCVVGVRPIEVPAFLENESAVREAGWRHMERTLAPQPGEWVLSIDADEFLVADSATVESDVLGDMIARADAEQADAVTTPRHEVFGFDTDGTPMVRVDGCWGDIVDHRLVRWIPGGAFRCQTLAGGSLPSYVQRSVFDRRAAIVHVGYATEQDRRDKHARYLGREGHGRDHIDSILAPPTLERWTGKRLIGGTTR